MSGKCLDIVDLRGDILDFNFSIPCRPIFTSSKRCGTLKSPLGFIFLSQSMTIIPCKCKAAVYSRMAPPYTCTCASAPRLLLHSHNNINQKSTFHNIWFIKNAHSFSLGILCRIYIFISCYKNVPPVMHASSRFHLAALQIMQVPSHLYRLSMRKRWPIFVREKPKHRPLFSLLWWRVQHILHHDINSQNPT